jgi:hypothetical protein
MEICFESDTVALKAIWLPGNSSLSVIEYIACWTTILNNVEILKPSYLLIDASDFEYRILPDVYPIFNKISNILKPENIAIVSSNYLLGRKTIENILNSCPHKGYNIFLHRDNGHIWFKSNSSNFSNHL